MLGKAYGLTEHSVGVSKHDVPDLGVRLAR
jgi:hypothetical protein